MTKKVSSGTTGTSRKRRTRSGSRAASKSQSKGSPAQKSAAPDIAGGTAANGTGNAEINKTNGHAAANGAAANTAPENANTPASSNGLADDNNAQAVAQDGAATGANGGSAVNGAAQVSAAGNGAQANGASGAQANGASGAQANGASGTQANGTTGEQANGANGAQTNGTQPNGAQANGTQANGSGNGGKANGSGANGSGSNGSRPNGATPGNMESRTTNTNFREVMTKGLATCRRNMVTVGIFSFIVNALVLAVPIYLFNIADRVLTSQSIDTLMMLTIIVCGAILMHVLLDIARRIILLRVATDMESKLGAPVLAAAARASQNGSSREFQILGELQHLRSFITGPVILTMFDAPVAPLYMAAVFLIHPHLGLLVTGAALGLLVIAGINQKMTAVPFGRANAFSTRANLQADAMARNSQAMNAMGMIPEGVRIWGSETAESMKSQVIAQDRNILLAGISRFLRLVTQISLLGWGAYLAITGSLTGGMIIAASIIGSRALQPIEGVIEGWKGFVQARSAYARIKSLLLNSPLNFDRLRLPRPQGRLSVERVLYVPPPNKKVILNGVSLELEPGESLAIVGASGAGKSTLGKMLVGSVFPTSGNVRLDSMDLRNWDSRQFGENVGYLPQDVQLFPATIKANIARMRTDASDQDIFDAAEMADVHAMISDFAQGYETQVAMDGSPLSGGQKQRIGLARAFFGNPRLVVLDEPNSNLDTPGERALANALAVAKDKQITVIAITQRPSLLRSVDKIMILKSGTVQALGNRDDIIPLITARRPSNGSAAQQVPELLE